MKLFIHTRNKFRLSIAIAFTVFVLILSYVFRVETLNMAKEISVDYAQLYASEAEKFIQSKLMRDVALVEKAANTQAIKEWLKNEGDENLKAKAYAELLSFCNLLQSENVSVTVDKGKHYYHLTQDGHGKPLLPIGTLEADNASDQWYFQAIANDNDAYTLKVAEDRFIESARVWINVRVVDQGVILGNIGSGLEVKPIVDEFFDEYHTEGATVMLINDFGAIQMSSQLSEGGSNDLKVVNPREKGIYQYFSDKKDKAQVASYLYNPKAPLLIHLTENTFDFLAVRPIAGTHWHIAVFFSASALMERYDFKILYGLILVVVFGLGIIFTRISSQILMKPLEKLNRSLAALKEDPDRQFYGLNRTDEYGALAKTIQQMKERERNYSRDLEAEVARRSLDLEEALQKIRYSEERLEKLFKTLPVGIFRIDSNLSLVYCNDFFKQQFETEREEQLRRWLSKGVSVAFAEQEVYLDLVQKLKGLPESLYLELKLMSSKGNIFWADVRLSKVAENEDYFYDGTLINIQSQKEVESNLINLVNIDPLTGIFNRHYFDSVLTGEVNRSERYEEALTMVIFDLDHFKYVNDNYGHDQGDEVLKRTAVEAQQNVRKSDILIRWGGEEFAILMPYTARKGGYRVAEKIRNALETLEHEGVGKVTASFGVAEHLTGESIADWFKRADTALFSAKNAGRNCVRVSEDIDPAHTSFIKLIWKKEFESGDPRIDEQHKALFQYANQIKDMSLLGKDIEKETQMFEKIIQHVLVHFRAEEDILREFNYPDLEEHQKIHEGLVEEIARVRKAFGEGTLGVADVFTFLTDVVIAEHLFHEDVKFFDCIRFYKKNGE